MVVRPARAIWMLLLVVMAAGCVSGRPAGVRQYYLRDFAAAEEIYTRRLEKEKRSRALYLLLLGMLELDRGEPAEARERFIEATGIMESFAATGQTAAIVGEEAAKEYKGDPYERMMAHWYLGLLDYMLGEYDKAVPDFKSAALADGGSKDERYQGDAALVLAMLGKSYLAMGRRGEGEVELGDVPRAGAHLDAAALSGLVEELSRPSSNLLVVVGVGAGPYKYRSGLFGEKAEFARPGQSARCAEVYIDGERLGRAVTVGDVYYQATTRGGREMDAVLAGKAASKVVMLEMARREHAKANDSSKPSAQRNDARTKALAYAAAAALIRPEADVRSWEALPAEIQLFAGRVPPGLHTLHVRFIGAGGESCDAVTWENVSFHADGETVVYVRSGMGGAWTSSAGRTVGAAEAE